MRCHAAVRIACIIAVLLAAEFIAHGQERPVSEKAPAFEVVSVRPLAATESRAAPIFVRIRGGRLEARTSLREVIRFAYALETYQRIDSDQSLSRLLDEWFEIVAKPPDESVPSREDVVRAMTRTMLADRFKVKARLIPETRTVSVLRRRQSDVLGPKLRQFNSLCTARPTGLGFDDPAFLDAARTSCSLVAYNGQMRGTAADMSEFARFLSSMARAPVIDETGLKGRFQVQMDFDPGTLMPGGRPTGDLPSFNDALRRDLGLMLEREQRPVPALIVQHAEMPRGN